MLEKYNEIRDKVSKIIKKGFDNEQVYNEKYFEGKSYEGKANTYFHNNKMLKERPNGIYLSVELIDCVFKMSKNCYLQVFLEKCKHIVKEKEVCLGILLRT